MLRANVQQWIIWHESFDFAHSNISSVTTETFKFIYIWRNKSPNYFSFCFVLPDLPLTKHGLSIVLMVWQMNHANALSVCYQKKMNAFVKKLYSAYNLAAWFWINCWCFMTERVGKFLVTYKQSIAKASFLYNWY